MALACQNFDSNVVNKVLLNNCGISGSQFAEIMGGLSRTEDCKSIVYIKNELDRECLPQLESLLARDYPRHLDELKLVDLKV